MIKEFRKLDKINHAKANYIRCLQSRGCISRIISDKGFMAYDTDELKTYKANVRVGRPIKKI